MIWSLLFNRYSFLLIAIAIVVALVFFQKLVWNKWTIGGLLALAITIGAWTGTEKAIASHDARIRNEVVVEYNTKIRKQKDEAKAIFDKAIVDGKKQKEDQDAKDTVNDKAIALLAGKLYVARLRDPNAGRGTGGSQANSSSTGKGQESGTETSGLLSTELTGLLTKLTREADEINVAYISCRADADNVRKQ